MQLAGSAQIQIIESQLTQTRAQIARTRKALASAGLTHRPAPPEPTTCCGRGCHGCVWEGWTAAVQYWLEQADDILQADQLLSKRNS